MSRSLANHDARARSNCLRWKLQFKQMAGI
jgi:hypothetical protein